MNYDFSIFPRTLFNSSKLRICIETNFNNVHILEALFGSVRSGGLDYHMFICKQTL